MKRFFKIVLCSLFALVVVCAVALFVFIKTFDLNKYKNQISNIVFEQTGRQLVLHGNAGLKISLIPTLELNDVTFSNAAWAKEPNMIEAKTIDVAFSIMPLFKKEIVVDKIHLTEPKVYLSVNEKGITNWDFNKKENGSETKEKAQAVSNSDIAQGAMIASIVAKSFKIENGEVVYQDLKTKEKHDVKLKNVTIKSDGMDDNIEALIDVQYNDNDFKANIVAGPINSVLKNTKNYPIKAELNAFGAEATVEGVLSDLMGALEYDLKVVATNPKGNMGAPYVKINTTAKGNIKKIMLDIASLNVASNEVKGTVDVDLSGKKVKVKTTLISSMIDLQSFSQTQNAYNQFNLISTAHAATFVPATPIDLRVLNLIDVNARFDIKKLVVNNDISLNDILLDVLVNDGKADINIKELKAGDGSVIGTISANAKNVFKINLNGKDIVLQNLVKGLNPDNKDVFGITTGGKTTLMLELSGSGKDVRSVVENLAGQAIVIVGESEIQVGTLKYLRGDFISQILSAMKLKQNDKKLDLNCLVVRTDIIDGKASFPKGVAFKSNKITIVSDGYVNLKNDAIDLSIKPFNGKLADTNVAQAITSLLKVSGTVQKPRLTIDNSAVIKNVVGIAAAGPAFLGSQMLFDVDDYPCYTALKGTKFETLYPAPSGIKATGKGIYQGANDVVNESVNLVNDAAKGVINFLKGKK